MTRLEKATALREDPSAHYNCCQSVLIPFCDVCGLDEAAAGKLGAHFGSGMRHGSTCGVVTGGLMVLGLAGRGGDKSAALLKAVRENHGVLDCAHLLAKAKEAEIPRKSHCDGMVYEMVALLETLL